MKKYILTLAVLILTGCATPAQQVDPSGYVIAPGVAAESARQTKEAYGAQEDFYNSQASATSAASTSFAFAPYATGTQAAVELAVQKMYSDATSTAAASTQTADANLQAFNARSTSEAGIYTQVASVTQQAMIVIQRNDELAFERARSVNMMKASFGYFVFIVILFVATAWAYTMIKRLQFSPVGVSPEGAPLPLLNFIDGTFTDLDRSANGTVAVNQKYLELLPKITDERQSEVTRLAQLSNMHTRRRALPHAMLKSQGLLPEPETDELEQVEAGDAYPELPLPTWVELNKWDGNLLPVGNDENSKLLLVDTSMRPHLLYAGRSRSGKTLTGERTAVACLLTQGWNVIVMGKRVDWIPFVDHPNFRLLAVDVRKDAQRYIDVLQVASAQMDIRDSLLTSKGIGTWERYGAPSTMLVLDDYSGALIRMPNQQAKEVTAEVRSIALDGAKFGLSITIGLQDATAQNIDTTTRSQMARIVYSMDNATKSRIALGGNVSDGAGADRLPAFRHFLARVSDDSNIRRGVGFFLQDREVETFLASRPVQQNDGAEWVEGVIIDHPVIESAVSPRIDAPPASLAEFVSGLADKELWIVELYQDGSWSQAEIEDKVFGYRGGAAARKVKVVLDQLRSVMGSPTMTTAQ